MQSWTIQPIVHPLLLAVFAAILVGLLLLKPTAANLSTARRTRLLMIRLAIIGLAFVATLRPGCIQKQRRNQSATVKIMGDLSRSMDLPHISDDSTRYQAMVDMITDNQSLINELSDAGIRFEFVGFDRETYELEFENGQVIFPGKPEGSETDLFSAVFQTALDSRKERLVGLIVASDGVVNVSDPQIEIDQAGNILDDMSVPLFAIPFGTLGDTGQVADAAVLTLPEQHRIAVKNQLNVETTVSIRGFANRPVTVELFVADNQGNEQLVDTNQFVPESAYVEKKIQLRHNPLDVGQFRMKVKITPSGDEVATRNNELSSFLNVYEGGLRVFYLDGGLGWEQKFLRDALATSAQDVELIHFSLYSDELSRREWPLGDELTRWFNDPTIDVFIIGDVDSRALFSQTTQTKNMKSLVDAIERGKGFLMLGGAHSFGAGSYHSTPLDDYLPIEMDIDERQDFPPAKIRRDLHINEPVKLIPTKDHYITRLGAGLDFRAPWKDLPPLLGANRFVGVKDNAEILLKSESGQPVLVAGQVGGRILAFAGDSTWRWVMRDYEVEFKQFWRQVLLWLAAQDGREKNSVWIDLPKRRLQPGSFVSFQCQASDTVGTLLKGVNYTAELLKPDKTTIPLSVDAATAKGRIEQGILNEPGVYQIRLSGQYQGKPLEDAAIEFVVFDRDREKASAAADPDQMVKLAAQTEKHGGRMVLPEDFGALLQELKDNPPEAIEVPLKWQLGQTVADASAFLLLFTLMLGIEWVLRKKWGLV